MKIKSSLFAVFFVLIVSGFLPVFSFAQNSNWLWAKGTSGFANDIAEGYSVATDISGNVFITGNFGSSITFGAFTLTVGDGLFLAKYDSNGNVLWAKGGAGTNTSEGVSVTTDASGNAYVTGDFSAPSITFGSYTITNTNTGGGFSNVFLVKYDPFGNVLWAKGAGGIGVDSTSINASSCVATDAFRNVYITGTFNTSNIVFSPDTLINSGTNSNVFFVKYDSLGNVLWTRGAIGIGTGNSVATDTISGNIYLMGKFAPPAITIGTNTLTNSGVNYNLFLAKYDTAGNPLWATSVAGNNEGGSIATDANSGNIYITGVFASPSITFGSNTLTNSGGGDFFLAKYDASGNALWAKSAVGTNDDFGNSVSTDGNGNIYVSGGSFPPSPLLTFGALTFSTAGADPMFIIKYDSTGNVLCGSVLTSGADDGNSVATDRFGNAYVGGDYYFNSLIVGADTLILTSEENVFVAKFRANCGIESINELSNEKDINIYPNPSSNHITISINASNFNSEYEIKIFNSIGEQVEKVKVVGNKNEIDVFQFDKGIYLITVSGKDFFQSKKIIIE